LLSDAVLETIRTYACKAGISDPFGDFAHVLSSYRECEAALATGQVTDPHLWYYRFGDMGLDYIMCKATEDFPAELLASKKLLALVRADEDGQGEYVKTLRCYLDNRQSATRTAEELFMHRTSLLRRLERIVRISGIDFDDADEVLYLALSLRMLDRA
jgi:DNA-binding PucR family transcriptional regulator